MCTGPDAFGAAALVLPLRISCETSAPAHLARPLIDTPVPPLELCSRDGLSSQPRNGKNRETLPLDAPPFLSGPRARPRSRLLQ